MAKRAPKKRTTTKRNKPADRRNPLEQAREQYQGFHGRQSESTVEVSTPFHYHTYLWGLGELVKLVILTEDKRARVTLKNFGGTLLAANEKRNQLFLEGGDQSVDLKEFGIPLSHESEVLGKCHRIYYYTTKDHLGDDGGEAIYNHKFGGRRQIPNPGKKGKRVRVGRLKFLDFSRARAKRNAGGKSLAISRPPTVLYDSVNKLISFAGGGYTIPDEGIDG